jgi:ParB family chromosome partitioning protein
VADLDWQDLRQFARRYPERVKLSKKLQKELDRLSDRYDELVDSDDDAHAEQLEQIEQRIAEINALAQTWPADTLALAGAIVSLDHDGSVSVERGLVRKEDLRDAGTADEDESGDDERPSQRSGVSPKLIEDLTAQRSAAIGAELMSQPNVALAAVVHCLTLGSFYSCPSANSCLELSSRTLTLRGSLTTPDACKGFATVEQERDRMRDRLPGNPDDLLQWCLDRSRDELLELLALIAASTVNAVQRKQGRPDCARLEHATYLAKGLKLDVGAWFTPTADNYFSRINRAQILAAIDEAKGEHAPALDKLKKTELATRVQGLIAGTGWLPAPMRIAANENASRADAMPVAAE